MKSIALPRRLNNRPAADAEVLKVEVASQWQLMWWKFRRHKLAMISAVIVLMLYFVAGFCEFVAPRVSRKDTNYVLVPPQTLHLFRDGRFAPFVHGYTFVRDERTLERVWTIDESTIIPVGLFVKGDPYKLWGLIPGDIHLIGAKDPKAPFFLFGSDSIGRDVFSRLVYSGAYFSYGGIGRHRFDLYYGHSHRRHIGLDWRAAG
jgi:peptide/nickel transport system permease protein